MRRRRRSSSDIRRSISNIVRSISNIIRSIFDMIVWLAGWLIVGAVLVSVGFLAFGWPGALAGLVMTRLIHSEHKLEERR